MLTLLLVILGSALAVVAVRRAVRKRYASLRAAEARSRQLARTGRLATALAAVLLAAAAPASASSMLHCEEWPHWQKAYDNLNNYDHTGGEAVQWLQLAGCPPVWAETEGYWLPNGSDCNAPCEVRAEEERVVEATLTGRCEEDCAPRPPANADHRREPLTFTVVLDTERRVQVEATSSTSDETPADEESSPCSCERERLRVGQTTSCTYTGPGDVQWEVNGVGFPTGQIELKRLTVASDESGQMVVNWQPGEHCDSVTFRDRHWLKSPWTWIAGSIGGLGLHAAFGGGDR